MHQHYITKFLGIKIELILTKMNQLTMNQRLKILIEHLGFTSVRSFAKHIGEDYPDKQSRFTVVTTKKPAIQWIASELLLF
jgi:hypothetical protein